ncbi:MAG: hypothetical protein RL404_1326 [Pseudomonadota bacterium]|jgi:hypothetical protein
MPEISNQTISPGLAQQLANLSGVAADYKADAKVNKAALEAAAARTLAAIDAESGNLNVSSGQFAQAIKALISSKDWAKLPPPKQMAQRTEQLAAVNDAIRDVQKTIIADISSIMAILVEMQRKAAMNKSAERIQERNATVASAAAEFKKRELAATEQLVGDMVSAGMQCVTGVLSTVMSGKSIAKIKGAHVKTAEAWSKTKDLKPGQVDLIESKKLLSHLESAKPGAKKIVANGDAKIAQGRRLIGKELRSYETAKTKLSDINAAERKVSALEGQMDISRQEITNLNREADEITQLARARQDLWQGVSGALRASGDMVAASMKFAASITQVEADKEALAKNLATSGEQASLDAYQQLRDSLKSALQMIQAIEQSMSSSMSSISRSI